MNLKEIMERQDAIRSELKTIEDNPGQVEESDTDYIDTLVSEYDTLEERRQPLAERAQKLNLIQAAYKDDAVEPAVEEPSATKGLSGAYTNKRDPFEDMGAVRSEVLRPSELRGRALDAVEFVHRAQWCDFSDDYAERATKLVEQSKDNPQLRGMPRHVLLTGSEEYYEQFRAYMRDPEGISLAQRATTNATGSLGYMLPFVLDPTIILTNSGSANPYRRVSRVEQTTSNTWNGITSAGVNAAMGSEAAAATDASPTVAQLQITPQRARAWVFGSYESLEDSDLGSQLPQLFADAKDRLEESQFATGAGTGVFPQGVITGGTTGATAAATAYAVADVYTTQANLSPRFRNSSAATWLANLYYLNKTRQFDTAGGSSFWANLGQSVPEQLLGKPIYESSSMSSATASGTNILVFGDFQQFVIVDRIGMSILYNPMVMSAATGNLPTGEAGWFAFWRYSSKVSTASAFRVLQLT